LFDFIQLLESFLKESTKKGTLLPAPLIMRLDEIVDIIQEITNTMLNKLCGKEERLFDADSGLLIDGAAIFWFYSFFYK